MKTGNVLLALMSYLTVTLGSTGNHGCEEGSLKCDGGSPGGAVFACKDGAWEVLVDCGESACNENVVPHCTWASAGHAFLETDLVSGFESPTAVVSAAIADNKDIKVEAPGDAPTGSDDTTSPYYNICSPCIRHNDYCKDSCAWQGKECDASCNWKTCSVNLTTGDFRQPTVSCGRFCKWPCH